MKNLCISLAMVALALSASAERQSFDRYQSIVDRQMFGPPPEGFDPTKPPSEATSSREARKASEALTKEQEKLKSAIHFSMINVTPAGETAVGFTDKSDAKNPINYYLKVGESRGGWTVREADPVASSMTIVKGDVEVSLTIGGDSAKGAGKTAAAGSSSAAGGRLSRSAVGSGGSLGARRSLRRAAENAKMEALTKQFQEREAAAEKRREEERLAREEREAQDKAAREAEREEQRKQLLQIQEELKRAREEKVKTEKEEDDNASDT